MSEIILPPGTEEESEDMVQEETVKIKINYKATQEDEEKFLLMYHLHMQPSETDGLDPDRRRWILARFMQQMKYEQQAFMDQQMNQQIAATIDPKTLRG